MKITRRPLCVLLLCAFAVLPLVAQKSRNTHYLALVGTYTNKTSSKGIYAFDFDPATGKLTPKGVAAQTPDPSWIAMHLIG